MSFLEIVRRSRMQTQYLAPIEAAAVQGEISETSEISEKDIAWRVSAFRARFPAYGPIWPPKLRHIPETDTPGHCGLCGDVLVATDPPPRFPRCQPCIAALWLALTDVRGEGDVSDTEGVL